ncbi:MAG: hypothetical protein HYV06_08135 [Deltaproteobacteria bacterium]|nr:hypothetical protein [Deltaproteobacteria bacterium]
MEESGKQDPKPARRLCGEIKLFDLCDLDGCGDREGRFCGNQDLLARFEQISDEERTPERYLDEEPDEDDDDEAGYGDEFDDGYGDEGDGWEEE